MLIYYLTPLKSKKFNAHWGLDRYCTLCNALLGSFRNSRNLSNLSVCIDVGRLDILWSSHFKAMYSITSSWPLSTSMTIQTRKAFFYQILSQVLLHTSIIWVNLSRLQRRFFRRRFLPFSSWPSSNSRWPHLDLFLKSQLSSHLMLAIRSSDASILNLRWHPTQTFNSP